MQTAVEWLFQKLPTIDKYDPYYSDIIKQAKEMEKQQIIDAFGIGCHHESKRLVGYQDVAEQYYNETYGSKGSDDHIGDTNKMVEISDEEIDGVSENIFPILKDSSMNIGWRMGARWYREQLKSKQ